MLQRPPLYTAEHIDGRSLDRLLRRSTASQKAVIADDLRTGRLEVSPFTERQARTLAKASYGYVNIASKLTDPERAAVADGSRKLSEFAGRRREPTAAYFDRLVGRYSEQVMAALDRHTAPPTNGNGCGHANDNHPTNGAAAADELASQMSLAF